ncbi:hypothetical protein BACCIP111883_03950 [Sutcliffiella rhizosphaerae]|uniref:Uncharacterized protein n=2 Tax=Sutcliffiella rhizosphaerae TaxID=2880967 RepID=A0ABN8AD61_9BACI|nr:hypothetical protein BACCIP111883_03950 [Sutcliffiella rhizosphaerae]
MAVPTLGAKVIFEAILKTFAGIDYPSIEPKWKLAIEEAKQKRKASMKNSVKATKAKKESEQLTIKV